MTGEHRFGLGTLREAVLVRVNDSSLREVANEIGMSWSGLRTFLAGGVPHARTRGKLAAWYVSSKRPAPSRLEKADLLAATAVMAKYVEAGATSAIRETRLKAVLDELYNALGEKTAGSVARTIRKAKD
ncbi:MAG TPA: hypothetical protein VGM77_12275 [Gemmatimonadales bacterium]|jgi:hypothetical protein